MLPAFAAPGGCTIVVVPLLSLRAGLMTRCQALGIVCVSWESHRPTEEAAIVLPTPESTENPDFHPFLNRQRQLRRLDRIVIDECHVILNEQKDFRPAMARLGRLVSAQTQMVFLTATLPPTEEARFLHRIKHEPSEVGIYRARTSRRNVAYRVFWPWPPRGVPREPHQWLAQPEVLGFLQRRIRQARNGRVIVYANIKSQVDAISRELGCEAYHRAVLDQTGILQQFQGGQTRVIAATSALGMGIDIPDIRCVINLGRPRTLLDNGQESGRAGRDGLASEAVIMHPQGWDDLDPWVDRVSAAEFERVQAYKKVVEGVGCRRDLLQEHPRPRDRQVLQPFVQWGLDREFLEQEARRWLNQCCVCTVAGRDGDHELYKCRHPDSQTAKLWMVQVRSQIDYAPFYCCFRCGIPQSVFQGWQAGQDCLWRGADPNDCRHAVRPSRAAVQSAWQGHLAGRMVEQRVVFAQKTRRQVDAHAANVQEVTSVAALLGQATADGQGVEMQAEFCWLRRVCQASECEV
ncbi:P-loop containing nucleoside triphosphate hydrolase protein [Aspergillus foveolatus]|uniref:P-loop containing nucleoside triphosphate hydrolase protein n=1 Tax=Aspergillus foveolatus TaxID=210207 RepID=UPI003CCD50BC